MELVESLFSLKKAHETFYMVNACLDETTHLANNLINTDPRYKNFAKKYIDLADHGRKIIKLDERILMIESKKEDIKKEFFLELVREEQIAFDNFKELLDTLINQAERFFV